MGAEPEPPLSDLTQPTARISDLEAIILDMMHIASAKAPHLRQDFVQRFTKTGDLSHDLGDTLEARAVMSMTDSLRQNS